MTSSILRFYWDDRAFYSDYC